MKCEINNNFFCSNGRGMCTGEKHEGFDCQAVKSEMKGYCEYRKHKFPTPEQFKEEYGEDYPEEGAVYVLVGVNTTKGFVGGWNAMLYYDAISCFPGDSTVCACTPFGKPDDNWRPE
jgi:hypothetical protein